MLESSTPGPRARVGNREDGSLRPDTLNHIRGAGDEYMARELLRMRRELTNLRDAYARMSGVFDNYDGPAGTIIGRNFLAVSHRLNQILEGDK